MRQVYLDHAATTPPSAAACSAMLEALEGAWGNPSSHHQVGRAGLKLLDQARDDVAAYFGCKSRNVIFCASGTEADNLALRGAVDRWSARGRHIIVSAIEHEAILATAHALEEQGTVEVTVVGCDNDGRVDPGEVASAVRQDTILVSIMLANNETGVIQDLPGISKAVRAKNAATLIHTDAVQGACYLTCSFDALEVDLISISSHKLYGPKGAGCLLIRDGVFLSPLIHGGGQERNRRSGTEAVPALVGFGAALKERQTLPDQGAVVGIMRDRLITQITTALPDVIIPGTSKHRLPSCAPIMIPGIRNEQLLARLDMDGVCASGGSACSAGATQPSHVLVAMGYDDILARSLIRFSLGDHTTEDDVAYAAHSLIAAVSAIHDLPRTLNATAQ